MAEQQNLDLDWELSEDYYAGAETKKELKLEDFIEDGTEGDMADSGFDSGSASGPASDEALQRTIQDVRQVMALAGQGRTIHQIAQELALDPQYVYNIQVTVQGFHEDDEIAAAHLLMME